MSVGDLKSVQLGSQNRQGTVLVVDDEELVRMLVRTVLERNGYRVIAVESAAQAIERLPHDLLALVTDVRMPSMTGPELVEHLRQERPRLPVVFISGYVGEVEWDTVATAPTLLVKKPFESLQGLVVALTQVITANADAETQLDVPCLSQLLKPAPKPAPADASAR